MAKRRMLVGLGTAKSGVPASGTVTVSKTIPFRFKIAYLRVEHVRNQQCFLQVSIFIGPLGTNSDANVIKKATGAVDYLIGDDTTYEFFDLEYIGEPGNYLTAYYNNTDTVEKTGIVSAIVEEVPI